MNILILLLAIFLIVVLIIRWQVHAFLALLLGALFLGIISGLSFQDTLTSATNGFANILGWIGIILILGTAIGEILHMSGGARAISEHILKITGSKNILPAIGTTGVVVAIPVFVDVAYIMLLAVIRSLAKTSGKNILLLGLSLAAGLTAAHALIPPTPGPIAVAGILDADLGQVILINSLVALAAMAGGVWYARMYCDLPVQDDIELSKENDERSLNINIGIFWYALPIFLPLLLIAGASFIPKNDATSSIFSFFQFLGQPIIALAIGVIVAVPLLPKSNRRKEFNQVVENAILKSASVIMITGAGGAFGQVIKDAEIGEAVAELVIQGGIPGILLPFLLALALTTATGSITVSMVTSASIMAGMSAQLQLEPTIICAAIGAGALGIIHASSSFFWLLNQLHRAPPQVLYRTYSLQSLVMALSGFLMVLLLNFFT